MTVTIGQTTYTVTETDNKHVPYELHGPRGAHYGLMRNVPRPHMLFLFNMKNFTKSAPAAWLTDKDGTLKVVR